MVICRIEHPERYYSNAVDGYNVLGYALLILKHKDNYMIKSYQEKIDVPEYVYYSKRDVLLGLSHVILVKLTHEKYSRNNLELFGGVLDIIKRALAMEE